MEVYALMQIPRLKTNLPKAIRLFDTEEKALAKARWYNNNRSSGYYYEVKKWEVE